MNKPAAVMKQSDIEGQNTQLSAVAEMAVNRQTQEVQGAMVIAKKFPRDTTRSFEKIITSCKRKSLAEVACYEYPKGGTKVTGPSIRLAEAMAQNWGNLDFGVIELDQRHRESTVMAYCWDLETNTRQTKIFQVPHIRYSKEKGNTFLTDPRDIYEMIANQGARRLRACILGIIPGDIQDAAVAQCEATLKSDEQPIEDRVRNMVIAFKEYGVTQDDIETMLMQKLDACTERDILRLRKIYTSLKDGMSKKEDHFTPAGKITDQTEEEGDTKAAKLVSKLKKTTTVEAEPTTVEEKKPPVEENGIKTSLVSAIKARTNVKGQKPYKLALESAGLDITQDVKLEELDVNTLTVINEFLIGKNK
jgi:hypothetical protein